MASPDQPDDIKRKCAERRAKKERKNGSPLTKTGNPVGRPKGGSLAQRKVNELLESKDFEGALAALSKIANDPEHKHWAVAMKMLMDRGANVSNYEKSGSGSTPTININIGDTNAPVSVDGEVVDG